MPLRDARLSRATPRSPPSSAATALVRRAATSAIQVGDRIVVIGSPQAAREWSARMARDRPRGRRRRHLRRRRHRDRDRAHADRRKGCACGSSRATPSAPARPRESCPTRGSSTPPGSTRTSSSGSGSATRAAAVFAMRDDAEEPFAATLAKLLGVGFTIAIVHDADLASRLRARAGGRRGRRPALAHRRGDRPLRARPAHAAGGDARGRPLRGAGHRRADRERARRTARSASCR